MLQFVHVRVCVWVHMLINSSLIHFWERHRRFEYLDCSWRWHRWHVFCFLPCGKSGVMLCQFGLTWQHERVSGCIVFHAGCTHWWEHLCCVAVQVNSCPGWWRLRSCIYLETDVASIQYVCILPTLQRVRFRMLFLGFQSPCKIFEVEGTTYSRPLPQWPGIWTGISNALLTQHYMGSDQLGICKIQAFHLPAAAETRDGTTYTIKMLGAL